MPPGEPDIQQIDLGTLPTGSPGDRPSAAPRTHRRWRPSSSPAAAVTVLVCLALLVFGGSTRGRSPRPLPAVPLPARARSVDLGTAGKTIFLRDGLLTVWDQRTNLSYAATLGRPTGTWPEPLAGRVYGIGGGAAVHLRTSCTDGDALVDVFDARDGEPRAQVKGTPLGGLDGLLGMRTHPGGCVPISGDGMSHPGQTRQAVTVYDLTDGSVRWTSTAPGWRVEPAVGRRDGRAALYGIDAAGRWLILDLATGAAVGPSGSPAELSTREPGDGWTVVHTLLVTGDEVLVSSQAVEVTDEGLTPAGPPMVVDAFDAGTLRRRWSLRLGGWFLADRDPTSAALPPRLVVYRSDGDRTRFGMLDPARGIVQPLLLGWAPGRLTSCTTDGGYVACRGPDGHPGVWRLPG